MRTSFWTMDAQMARREPYFPMSHGEPRVDDRRVVSGMIFINRNGLRWCDAPRAYGPRKTLYDRWKRRSEEDWRRIATRHDRCPKVFLSAIALAAAAMFWL